MGIKTHKSRTASFEELSFKEQAQSINAMINNLGRAI